MKLWVSAQADYKRFLLLAHFTRCKGNGCIVTVIYQLFPGDQYGISDPDSGNPIPLADEIILTVAIDVAYGNL